MRRHLFRTGMKPYSALAGLLRVADSLEVHGELMLSLSSR